MTEDRHAVPRNVAGSAARAIRKVRALNAGATTGARREATRSTDGIGVGEFGLG